MPLPTFAVVVIGVAERVSRHGKISLTPTLSRWERERRDHRFRHHPDAPLPLVERCTRANIASIDVKRPQRVPPPSR